ncbi:hypothetical protein D3C81_2101770 [compost metagenome]
MKYSVLETSSISFFPILAINICSFDKDSRTNFLILLEDIINLKSSSEHRYDPSKNTSADVTPSFVM